MRLAIERGLENVVVEDIAAAAGVSPRTFSNYFASKYEAVCALALERFFQVGDTLRARPADESLWDAVSNAVLAVFSSASTAPDPAFMAGIRLVTDSPVLRGEYLKILSVMQYDLAKAIAERAGARPPDHMFFARAFAGSIIAVVQAATERWLLADPPVPLAPLVEDALRELSGGMLAVLSPGPQPPRSSLSP
jgi:AcrR family transcriptional regulator